MRLYPNTTVDSEFKTLRDAGYSGTLNDMQFSFLRAQGYKNALPDMMTSWLTTPVASFSPLELFAASEPGVWYDPSDVANLNWRRNLLTFTEQFDNAVWAKVSATVSANAGVAPDGTSTADHYVPAAGSVSPEINRAVSDLTASTTYVNSVYLKDTGNGSGWFELTSLNPTVRSWFDIRNGIKGNGVGVIQSVGNGWYRCSVPTTVTSTSTTLYISPRSANGNSSAITATAVPYALIWGAQFELGSTATEYQRITDVNTEVIERFPTATLYQDTAGTQPVTTPGQTVALALDKSKGLVLGPELVTNGDFSSGTGWTLGTGWTISGGTLNTDGTTFQNASQSISIVSGRSYRVTGTATGSGISIIIRVGNAGVTSAQVTTPGSFSYVIVAGSADTQLIFRNVGSAATLDNISVKELPGFHATQATLASRPTYGIVPLGGRRNLLTRTEEFGTSPWFKVGAQSVTSDAAVAPNGTTTAEKLIPSSASDLQAIYQGQTFSAVTYTASVYAKAAEYSWLFVRVDGVSNGYVFFNLSNGTIGTQDAGRTGSISSQGNGWYRCTVTWTSTGGTGNVLIGASNANATPVFAGDGTSGILIWGAQLETGSTATAYQRVGSAFDVTEAGVASLSYLFFGGEGPPNDARWLVTPTITPGIDKAQVFAGVRRLSNAASAIVFEHSTNSDSTNGSYSVWAPSSGGGTQWYMQSRGTAAAAASASGYTAPRTDVFAGISDVSGDALAIRVNGTQVAQSAADQGSGNFTAQPLYIGRRNGATLGFNGFLFGLIVRFGANLDANTITNTETWVAGKTGVTL